LIYINIHMDAKIFKSIDPKYMKQVSNTINELNKGPWKRLVKSTCFGGYKRPVAVVVYMCLLGMNDAHRDMHLESQGDIDDFVRRSVENCLQLVKMLHRISKEELEILKIFKNIMNHFAQTLDVGLGREALVRFLDQLNKNNCYSNIARAVSQMYIEGKPFKNINPKYVKQIFHIIDALNNSEWKSFLKSTCFKGYKNPVVGLVYICLLGMDNAHRNIPLENQRDIDDFLRRSVASSVELVTTLNTISFQPTSKSTLEQIFKNIMNHFAQTLDVTFGREALVDFVDQFTTNNCYCDINQQFMKIWRPRDYKEKEDRSISSRLAASFRMRPRVKMQREIDDQRQSYITLISQDGESVSIPTNIYKSMICNTDSSGFINIGGIMYRANDFVQEGSPQCAIITEMEQNANHKIDHQHKESEYMQPHIYQNPLIQDNVHTRRSQGITMRDERHYQQSDDVYQNHNEIMNATHADATRCQGGRSKYEEQIEDSSTYQNFQIIREQAQELNQRSPSLYSDSSWTSGESFKSSVSPRHKLSAQPSL